MLRKRIIIILSLIVITLGVAFTIIFRMNTDHQKVMTSKSSSSPSLQSSKEVSLDGLETIKYDNAAHKVIGDKEIIQVQKWEISKDSSGQPVLNVKVSFENKTSQTLYMQELVKDKIRIGQFRGEVHGRMDINPSSVADVVIDPNQKAEATISAHPIFDVPFDMEDMSKNQFVFQVIAHPDKSEYKEQPIEGLKLGFNKDGENT